MTDKKEDRNIRREKIIELQKLDEEIKQIEEQMTHVEEQIFEVTSVIDNLIELNNSKENDEILVPIANGIFLTAKISEKDIMKVNVGGGVVVDKSLNETIEMLKNQIMDIEKYKNDLLIKLQQMISQASSLQAYIVGER